MKKSQEVAKQFGLTMDFYKDGKFAGIDNFVTQIGKLQGLNPTRISAILKPFSGKQGLSTDFLEFIAKEGFTAMRDMKIQLSQQDSLNNRYDRLMSGTKNGRRLQKPIGKMRKRRLEPRYWKYLQKSMIRFRKWLPGYQNLPPLTRF